MRNAFGVRSVLLSRLAVSSFPFLCGFTLPLMVLIVPPATAADYQLGPLDKVNIRVVQWQTAEGAFREWPTITGDYSVGPSGTLSLPFAGEIAVAGKTTSQIASEIAKNLRQKFGLVDLAEASVEVSEFRPIFVLGDVQTPGKYPFDPEMTVLKAASLAGGMRSDVGQREFLTAQGNYNILVVQQDRLIVKRARLQTELNNAKEIEPPVELANNPKVYELMEVENAIMQSRRHSLDLQLNALDELKMLYQNEIVSLEKKMVVQNRQMDLTRKDLASIGGLAEKGLVVNSRVMTLQTSAADIEGKLLDLNTASLRAKQEINKATRAANDLENDRITKLATESQEIQAALDENNLKLRMYRNLMAEILANAPATMSIGSGESGPVMHYSIVRNSSGETQEIPAEENTPLLPGDLIKVTMSNGHS